jgi:hypothetical protein
LTEQQFSRAKVYRELRQELDEADSILQRLLGSVS